MDKDFLLNGSKTFCMFPWVHLNIVPNGNVYPCCVGVSSDPLGKITDDVKFDDIINNENFKELRNNMLADIPSNACTSCYDLEKFGNSFRKYANESFGHLIDEALDNTDSDGTLHDFKMRYCDVRFKNICNFKCRTCGPDYSSSWALEENRHMGTKHKIYDLSTNTNILEEFLNHIPNVELVYFAGGEPLITDEHYIILEKLIESNRTDVKLRYNTNCSVLAYKDKDLLSLWKHFDKIDISASIDHIGERAEYIRHGTDWAVIDNNLKVFREIPNVDLSINSVLSVFNYQTLDMLIEYLIENNILTPTTWYSSIIPTSHPSYFSATVLPTDNKLIGTEKLTKLISTMRSNNFVDSQTTMIQNSIDFANSANNWEIEKENLIREITKKDIHRNESFVKTFPELEKLLDM